MDRFIDNISAFLASEGFNCSHQTRNGLEVISAPLSSGRTKVILPLCIASYSPAAAKEQSDVVAECIETLEEYPLIVTQDRWNTQMKMMQCRILAHLEVFSPIYARNCEVRKIDKALAKKFLEENHSYGHAACRYCYGLYFKRHTGHIAQAESSSDAIIPGQLIAVATFSNARKWIKGEKTIRSYEWTRYASLPQVRLSGGMGRLLKAFIKEVSPDDIMSYADLEWSEGSVYQQLGFELEDRKDPVMFAVDSDWKRTPLKRDKADSITVPELELTDTLFFQNFGSNKYRLKLTDYK